MATTTNLGITLVEQAQAQKEVTVNTGITRIDAILNTGAKDKDLATPPGSPATGDLYIVAGSPTGAWSGKAAQLAYYDQAWKFIVPKEGMEILVNDEDVTYVYDGSAWSGRFVARTNVVNNFTQQFNFGTVGLTDGASISWNLNNAQTASVTLAGNRALANPTNQVNGGKYTLIVKQDATGSRTLSYGSNYKWPSGTAPVLTTTANAVDMLVFTSDGTNMLGQAIKDIR